MPRSQLPYGSWPSPVSVDMVVAGSISLREPRLDGKHVYWIEGRPEERGRQVIVRWDAEAGPEDLTPPEFNARTMAHEYGGGAYAVRDGVVYFSNLPDGRIYRQAPGEAPRPITPEGDYRYGDLYVDSVHQRLLCIREDHSQLGEQGDLIEGRVAEPRNELVAIDLSGATIGVLAGGSDFYSSPRPSPDGRSLAWLAWHHPNMPWDGTQLWVAEVDAAGELARERMVAGGDDESIVQPEWTADGRLVFASDRSGWWNLYRLAPGAPVLEPLAPAEAEFAGPQWVFGMSWFGVDAAGNVVAIARRGGRNELWRIFGQRQSAPEVMDVPHTEMRYLQLAGSRAVYIGASPTMQQAVVLLDIDGGGARVLRRQSEVELDPADVSVAEPITFPTTDGATSHALFYRPTSRDFEGPPGERPPLVVMSHGGPTSSAWGGLDLHLQFFTSRGIAVVDVDYRGSVGYGRDYMRQLDGRWGIVDVEDCAAAARHLAAAGEVDPDRMAITGGSAGGFTTLCELTFQDVFACGASHYGVGDLEALARETHKFESRYLDRLVAPYPDGVEIYRARSPIHFTQRLNRPVIVLQGADDKVVPVAQAEALVGALRARQIPHAYLLFEGEGHGFRQAPNIRRALEAEISFYSQVMGFPLADAIEPVEVHFLER